MLKNKKTYILAALAILTAVGGWLDGDLTGPAAIQLAVTGGLGATIRLALSSVLAAVTPGKALTEADALADLAGTPRL